jgi:hypothetical protein
MKLTSFVLTLAMVASTAIAVGAHASADVVDVYKSAQCACCDKWVEHMRANGFVVNVNVVADTSPYRAKAGVPTALGACHTAFVGGYTVEGHVPAADIRRLLAQRPAAKGLVVPDMPQTSPGMDRPHGEAWDVLLLASNGTTKTFTSYPSK